MSQNALTEGERLVKLETELEHFNVTLTRLDKGLRAHMKKEEEDRQALDKQLRRIQYMLVFVVGASLGPEYIPKFFSILVGIV